MRKVSIVVFFDVIISILKITQHSTKFKYCNFKLQKEFTLHVALSFSTFSTVLSKRFPPPSRLDGPDSIAIQ